MSTIDDVFSTVREAREDGPEALAALAVSYGAAALGGALRVGTLHGHLREARGYITSCEATLESERAKLDAARDEAKAARQRMEEVREQCDRARDDAEMCARQRDEARARASMLAQDLARVEAERDAAREALATAGKVTAQAVREREAFSLRLSAAERERDEARAALDLARESAREAREEIAQSLALVDEARAALDAALARPTYEARTVAPTPEELAAHDAAGGGWLVSWGGERYRRATVFWSGFDPSEWTNAGHVWIAFDASGLPCAWPVAP